jgi:hypothetical protein
MLAMSGHSRHSPSSPKARPLSCLVAATAGDRLSARGQLDRAEQIERDNPGCLDLHRSPAAEVAVDGRLLGGADLRAIPLTSDYDPPLQVAEEVLGQCLARDGQQFSATDTREAAWSDVNRLDVLGVQWQEVVREAARDRFEAAVHSVFSAGQAREVFDDPAVTWLWR